MKWRRATAEDCDVLGELNHQLIRDEGHRNPMTVTELAHRMKKWLDREYTVLMFEEAEQLAAYAVFREDPEEVYLRQLFVVRNLRRKGVGREAVRIMRSEVWPTDKRLTVDVLAANQGAVAFWRAIGYRDYGLTLEIVQKAEPNLQEKPNL
jgi:predicted acetyltransferase